MLESVITCKKSLEDYGPIVGNADVEEIRQLAEKLKGLRLLHINSTASGGGVAELLNSLVPLESDCGLDVNWSIICKDEEFFNVTKRIHNALQGLSDGLSPQEQEAYLTHNRECADMLEGEYDVIIVHDPQPAAFLRFLKERTFAKWIWRCHIDTSQPDPDVWDFIRPFVADYDALVFTMPEFVPSGFAGPRLEFITPAIDPLSPKNRVLPKYLCRDEVGNFGIDLERPLVIQVSRFDMWKDPLGVVEAYRLVKRDMPTLQLALVGVMAEDDPEAWEVYHQLREAAGGDGDVHILSNLNGVNAHEVNAFQRVADVIVQKSLKEGFGLVVSEALWKGTPVVAGNTGGIRLQMEDGVGGFLVDSVGQAADRINYLLNNPGESELIARRGWARVHQRFLTPRLLKEELKLIDSLAR